MMKNITTNKKQLISRWRFIIAGIIIFICLGAIYSWSIFRKPFQDLLEIDATQSGLPYMFFLVFYASLMPISGGLIQKYGPRKVMLVGGIFVGLGWFGSGYANNIYMLVLTCGIIAGAGVGMVYGGPIAVISKWFPEKKGLAVGLTLIGFGLSPFVTAPFAQYLMDSHTPFYTFKVLGIIFIVVVCLLSLLFRFPKDGEITISQQSTKVLTVIDVKPKKMLKSRNFYGLWICYTIGTLIGLMAIGITSPVGEEIIHLESRVIAFMVSAFAVFNGIGRPLFGWMADRFKPAVAILTIYVITIVASILMLMAQEGTVSLYVISFALLWLTLGGWMAIAPTATAIFFGSKHYSNNYGIVFTAYGVGAIIGVLLSGKLRDLLGSYQYTFYPTIALAIIGMGLCIFFLYKKDKKGDEGYESK